MEMKEEGERWFANSPASEWERAKRSGCYVIEP